jgi:amino-acid N-acetyltransferase
MTDMSAINDTSQPVAAQLRPARADDLAAVERLLVASHLPLDGVRDALPTFIVAESGTDIVGVAGLEVCCDNALLRSVAVHDAWRSQGLGRALVTRMIAEAEARGIDALYLLTTTAERYFPSFGFRTIERDAVPDDIRATAEFQGACPASATVMCRDCAAEA